jgi:hypothetical protein
MKFVPQMSAGARPAVEVGQLGSAEVKDRNGLILRVSQHYDLPLLSIDDTEPHILVLGVLDQFRKAILHRLEGP